MVGVTGGLGQSHFLFVEALYPATWWSQGRKP